MIKSSQFCLAQVVVLMETIKKSPTDKSTSDNKNHQYDSRYQVFIRIQ